MNLVRIMIAAWVVVSVGAGWTAGVLTHKKKPQIVMLAPTVDLNKPTHKPFELSGDHKYTVCIRDGKRMTIGSCSLSKNIYEAADEAVAQRTEQ